MQHQLEGKVAIVTGASAGIGRAAARLFAAQGARVVAVARREAGLRQLAGEIEAAGGEAAWVAGDVRQEACAQAAVAMALERFEGLDIGFNNAGTLGSLKPVTELTAGEWQDVIATNLDSAFYGARHQIPAILAGGRGGALVFTSSFVGHTVGFPGMAAYAASKAGLPGLVRTLAAEYGAQGLRANALLPGGTDTEMGRTVADSEAARAAVANLHALKRLAMPEEIARSALYLVSDASSFTTGSLLLAEGGVSVCRA